MTGWSFAALGLAVLLALFLPSVRAHRPTKRTSPGLSLSISQDGTTTTRTIENDEEPGTQPVFGLAALAKGILHVGLRVVLSLAVAGTIFFAGITGIGKRKLDGGD